jgi:hypothetical protein
MSVIAKNMEMPKNCAYCPLSEYRNSSILDCKQIGTVGTASRDNNVLKRRHPNCPLIEVPTPHGDLVDRDALKNDMRNWNPSIIAVVDATPTVIEAEGSETDA